MEGLGGVGGNVGVEDEATGKGMFDEESGARDAFGGDVITELLCPIWMLLDPVGFAIEVGGESGN